jgi:hypothetical protein
VQQKKAILLPEQAERENQHYNVYKSHDVITEPPWARRKALNFQMLFSLLLPLRAFTCLSAANFYFMGSLSITEQHGVPGTKCSRRDILSREGDERRNTKIRGEVLW